MISISKLIIFKKHMKKVKKIFLVILKLILNNKNSDNKFLISAILFGNLRIKKHLMMMYRK